MYDVVSWYVLLIHHNTVLITFETSFVGIFVLVIRHDSANTDVSTMFNESTEPLSHVDDYFVAI